MDLGEGEGAGTTQPGSQETPHHSHMQLQLGATQANGESQE